jgi:hypothetical protein
MVCLLSRFSDGRFRHLASADIARGGGQPNHLSPIVMDREDGEGDIDQPPISRLAHGLESLDTCPLPHLAEEVAHLIASIWRRNEEDRLPDRFLSPVAVQALRGGIPVGNDPIQCFANDRVGTGVDDCRQSCPVELILPSLFTLDGHGTNRA